MAKDKWNKHATNTVGTDCFVFLTNYHHTLPEQQKNEIANCAAKCIKASFRSPDAFRDVQGDARFQFMDSITRKCAKGKLGLNLEVAKHSAEVKANQAQMVGHWYEGKRDFYLSPDGKVAITFDPDRDPERGTWTLTDNVLILQTRHILQGEDVTIMRMEAFQGDFFLYRIYKNGRLHKVEKR